MKALKTVIVVVLVGLAASRTFAEGKGEGRPPGGPGGPRPMMENLVPPMLVEELKLTSEQKAKLDELNAAFKKDAEALREKRQAGLEKFRALLTDEQKAKLEEAKEKFRERRGEHRAKDGEKKGPKPPPAE